MAESEKVSNRMDSDEIRAVIATLDGGARLLETAESQILDFPANKHTKSDIRATALSMRLLSASVGNADSLTGERPLRHRVQTHLEGLDQRIGRLLENEVVVEYERSKELIELAKNGDKGLTERISSLKQVEESREQAWRERVRTERTQTIEAAVPQPEAPVERPGSLRGWLGRVIRMGGRGSGREH